MTHAGKMTAEQDAQAQAHDPFAFSIQLNTEEEDRGFRRENDGDEIQRPDVVDDCCQGLLLMSRIDRIVHGREVKDGSLATLVVFGFRFHGIDENRRFKQAVINVTFQDEQKRERADPEVIALWPNGDFTLGEPTELQVEETDGGEAGGEVQGGVAAATGGGHIVRKWERKLSYKKAERARLTGSIVLDTDIRRFGRNNGFRLTLTEDTKAATGLVTDLRAAVLLRRANDTDRFTATVKITAKAHFAYNVIRGIRDISGLSPRNDPVIFKPGVQYLRPASLGDFLEEKLQANIDEDNLNSGGLGGYAGVLGSTVLATSG
ncbi:uncharacterized protein B0H64DRAFT_409031 [Chaetomium fimeti]|uniref:Uncharacterized protein n=1 Tax=Chaetomium fimeti TaxID=1854472 RepID=A0AAE0LN97_9PEZI|nr:hypothetical protein B0H64DRAFT_409031 [Chaetomium fimeti]